MPRPPALFVVLTLVACPLSAQWHVAVTAGPAGARGHSVAPQDSESPQLRPAPTRDIAVTVGHDAGPWRVALRVRRTHADLVIAGSTAGIVTNDVLRATSLGVEVGRRLIGPAHGTRVVGVIGIARERWSFHAVEGEGRHRALVTAALEGEVPLARRWLGVVRVEGAVGGSVFEPDELPVGYESRSARRTALHLGVRWQP